MGFVGYFLLTLAIMSVLLITGSVLMVYSFNKCFKVPENTETMSIPEYEKNEENRKRIRKLFDSAVLIPYEEIKIKSFDGYDLYGRYYHVKDNAPIQIMFHGYRGYSLRDFAAGMQVARDMGYNVILPDQRAHGNSGGKCLSMGILERLDCLKWTEYAKKKYPESDVILYGISMGAATVLMASELDLPKNVKGIVADCPYNSPKDIMLKFMQRLNIPSFMYFFIHLGGEFIGNFNLEASSPETAVSKTDIPIFLIHGSSDTIVPVDMSRKIYKNIKSENKDLLIIENAEHGLSYIQNEKEYMEHLCSFLSMCIDK